MSTEKTTILQDFSTRLKWLVKERYGGEWSKLAHACGIKTGTFAPYMQGIGAPNYIQVLKILAATRVNPSWLLTGDGGMFKAAQDTTGGSNDTRGLEDLYAHLKTLGETNRSLLERIADLEGRELPTIAVPMDPEFWNALMRLPQEHFDAMKAATLSVVREHGLSEPDESRPVLHVSIQSAKGRL